MRAMTASSLIPDEAVYEAVRRERSASPTNSTTCLSAEDLCARLQDKYTAFLRLNVQQVRTADKRINEEASLALESESQLGPVEADDGLHGEYEYDDDDETVGAGEKATIAERCRVHGQGVEEAKVRQAAYFWIEAFDGRGRKRTEGGDAFFVHVRGPSVVRASVTDNNDGSYLVVWKPSVSGTYVIAVSLFGVTVPSTPRAVVASTTLPCPAKCVVKGEHTRRAVSRATHSFEVHFKDRLGQVAPAIDVDVFVEPVPPSACTRTQGANRSPRARAPITHRPARAVRIRSAPRGAFATDTGAHGHVCCRCRPPPRAAVARPAAPTAGRRAARDGTRAARAAAGRAARTSTPTRSLPRGRGVGRREAAAAPGPCRLLLPPRARPVRPYLLERVTRRRRRGWVTAHPLAAARETEGAAAAVAVAAAARPRGSRRAAGAAARRRRRATGTCVCVWARSRFSCARRLRRAPSRWAWVHGGMGAWRHGGMWAWCILSRVWHVRTCRWVGCCRGKW